MTPREQAAFNAGIEAMGSARILPTPRLAPPAPALDPFPPRALTAADLIAMAQAARRMKLARSEDGE